MVDECGDVVAELTALVNEGEASLSVGADDEQLQRELPGERNR